MSDLLDLTRLEAGSLLDDDVDLVDVVHEESGRAPTPAPGSPRRTSAACSKRFYRVDRARSRETGGTGLGLAIVRHVVESYYGSVDVRSELGRGLDVRGPAPGDTHRLSRRTRNAPPGATPYPVAMPTVLLIRHGHTDTAGKRLTGWARGIHLNAHGRAQAEGLVGRLEGIPVEAIYSSPLERCRETAAPLARARGLAVQVRRSLLEVDYGEWTGRSLSQLRRTKLWRVVQQVPSAVRFPDGETLLGVQERAVAEIDRIAEGHPEGIVAVVSHADVIRLALAHYAGMHLDQLQRLVVDPASVSIVAVGGGLPRLVKVNDTGDLASLVPRRPRTGPQVRG